MTQRLVTPDEADFTGLACPRYCGESWQADVQHFGVCLSSQRNPAPGPVVGWEIWWRLRNDGGMLVDFERKLHSILKRLPQQVKSAEMWPTSLGRGEGGGMSFLGRLPRHVFLFSSSGLWMHSFSVCCTRRRDCRGMSHWSPDPAVR